MKKLKEILPKFRNFFNNKPAGQIIKRVGFGLFVDSAHPLLSGVKGLAKGIQEVITDNKESSEGGKGQIDYLRLSCLVGGIAIVLLIHFEIITMDQVNLMLELGDTLASWINGEEK